MIALLERILLAGALVCLALWALWNAGTMAAYYFFIWLDRPRANRKASHE